MNEILKALISKNNELESMKQYIGDETAINIIKAKQDTINDIYELINSERVKSIVTIGE